MLCLGKKTDIACLNIEYFNLISIRHAMKNLHKQRFPPHESSGLNAPIVTWTAVVRILLTKTQFKILFAGKNNDAVSLRVIKPSSAAKTIACLSMSSSTRTPFWSNSGIHIKDLHACLHFSSYRAQFLLTNVKRFSKETHSAPFTFWSTGLGFKPQLRLGHVSAEFQLIVRRDASPEHHKSCCKGR